MTPTTRFIIVSNGRTGSTLLVDLLRSHPAIECQDEIFNEQRWQGWRSPLGWLVRAYPAPYLEWQARRVTKPIYGFKLKTGGQVHDLARALRSLHQRGWLLIYLHRRDALQQTFSWCVAQASGRWQSRLDGPLRQNATVTLNVEDFLRDLRTCAADRQALTELMGNLPHLPLVYETDLADSGRWPATGARLCAFLGIEPAPLTSRITRTWERPYAEVVSNYAEIMQAVQALALATDRIVGNSTDEKEPA